jgi:hypothetical protein
MARLTLRGIIPMHTQLNEGLRIPLDNGSFTDNYRVVWMEIWPNSGPLAGAWTSSLAGANILYVTLATDEDGLGRQNLEDNRQIGWACASGQLTVGQKVELLDPDHVIVEDLWIGAYMMDTSDNSTDVTAVPVQYLIHLDTHTSTEAEGVMQLVKERSQNVIPE